MSSGVKAEHESQDNFDQIMVQQKSEKKKLMLSLNFKSKQEQEMSSDIKSIISNPLLTISNINNIQPNLKLALSDIQPSRNLEKLNEILNQKPLKPSDLKN